MILVIDTGVSLCMLIRMQITKPLEIIVTSVLATNTYCHRPLLGTVLHYAKGNSCNQNVFFTGCNEAKGFLLAKKKESEG